MVNAYHCLLEAPTELVAGEVFNAGYENHTVDQLGRFVVDVIGEDVDVIRTPTDDNRSYHVSSEKMKKVLSFEPEHTIEEAIEDLNEAFKQGKLSDPLSNELYFNIKRMQSINLR